MDRGCIFCKIVAGQAPARRVYESEHVVAFHDAHPRAATHILVVPKKHIARLADMEAGDVELMGEVLLAAAAVAHQEGVSDGFRLVMANGASAGQTVFHVHFHLMAGHKIAWPG
jgi:histidine triad (HIT) family protein